ncbi:CD4-2 molecule, tandem duplicate 2 [Colossoma macropomum]|uniref:CD4-2 molecule, tandem duplicate 2 n=1 Tax=Colossoma macropomum TaxID=42526 RepID=UPI0018648124|nr:CD4-2 molecule, tandem duplicate 2 [Colossoma macropomum]
MQQRKQLLWSEATRMVCTLDQGCKKVRRSQERQSQKFEWQEMTASVTSITCLWVCLALCAATGRSEVFYRKSGEGVTMNCNNADGAKGIEWKHNNNLIGKISGRSGILSKGITELARKAKVYEIRLQISSVAVSHSGTYTCIGHDVTNKKVTLHHSLHVMSVSVSPSDTVLISTDVTLKCDVGGESTAQVQWMKPSGVEPYKSSGNTVTLNSVTSADAGQWTCEVRDEKGKVLGTIEKTLSVTGPLTSPEEVTAPLGGDAKLPCFLSNPSGLHIVGGGWTHNSPHDLQFLALARDASGLRWNGNKLRVAFSDEQLTTNFTVTLRNVQLSDAGEYICNLTFQDGKSLSTGLNLKVKEGKVIEKVTVAPGKNGGTEITAPLGGTAELPCNHYDSSSSRIVGGQWVRDPPTDFRLPILMRSGAKGLQWNDTDVPKSKVTSSDQQPSTNFNIRVKNVEHGDAGLYVCSLLFEDGKNWNTTLELKVEGVSVAPDARPPDSKQFLLKPVLFGLALWIWIAIAAGSLLLIVLVVVIALVQCRTQRKRKAEKSKIKTESAYIRESVPMQDEFPKKTTERRPRPGMKERPLPPVPKNQYKARNVGGTVVLHYSVVLSFSDFRSWTEVGWAEMSSSETLLWITLALCAATGGSDVYYKKRGQEVTMDCAAIAPKTTRDVEWKQGGVLVIKINIKSGSTSKGNAPLTKRARPNGYGLKIPSVEVGDSGDFSCSGFDARGYRITKEHKLHVVSVSVSPSDTVLISTNVTLRCDIKGDSTAQAQWIKPLSAEHYGSSGNTVTLNSVTSADAGKWICQIKDYTWNKVENIEQVINVVGPLQSPVEVTAPLGGAAQLPCFLSKPSGLHIVGGGWAKKAPTDLHFLTLSRNVSGLYWKDANILAQVAFSQEHLTTNFTVTLKNVRFADAGVYNCTVEFDGGQSLNTQLNLKVEGERGDARGSSFWEKPVLGVALWVWFAVAAASFILIDLVVVIVLKNCRKKRRTFFVKRTPRQPFPRRTEWPPPLPRPEHSAVNIYVLMYDHDEYYME